MASNQRVEVEDFQAFPPLSPVSQIINSPILSLSVIAVLELEDPFDKSQTIELLRDVLVPTNHRFSSIIVTDKKGVQRWKKVDELKIEEHIIIPTFPLGLLSVDDYNVHFNNYLSEIAMDPLPVTRPPWEVHVIIYPTRNGSGGSIVFKLSHALGDGYALMGTVMSCLKRADDPSKPISLPMPSARVAAGEMRSKWSRMARFVFMCCNTVSDFTRGMLQGSVLEDDKTVIRSALPRMESVPIEISSVSFSVDQIRSIKAEVGATVNDVVMGLLYYAIQLYIQKMGQNSSGSRRVTALCVQNMRKFRGDESIEDMVKGKIWGNQFGLSILSLPSISGDIANMDPLEFIIKAKQQTSRSKNSSAVYFASKMLNLMSSKGATQFIHSTLKNTSLVVSNVPGPMQKVVLLDHALNSIYFTVVGTPQSLFFTIMSYNGELKLVARTEKGFIDSELLLSFIKEAFEKFYAATHGKDAMVENSKNGF
ncbi:wax ester synthase/diacylglycerol acyltransferase 11-like [Telopea speciosissima]|uniref:wax ester synthase/diacylglycerol acyltransferase 11-like n=1 Tax=Telopea speciosissima TaxID=54955 RepID=UPI001CC67F0C|nr:wax ester synthase/diacylglycerol acyltransferase 11-like [Telopea speciosissima]